MSEGSGGHTSGRSVFTRIGIATFGYRLTDQPFEDGVQDMDRNATPSTSASGNDEAGVVKPPLRWDEERRLRLRARLDAVFFHLYGVTDRDDIRYVYSIFPIVERQETAEYGRYRSRDLCLAYLNALSAGRPDAEPDL